jgi:bifunctional DNA-binding transcriptional regulator/antitoxin component of YhaV-PrlF toxin-antitoxin module
MKKNPAQQYHSYEVITQKDDTTGDVLIPLPPQLLRDLGWKEGDEIDFQLDENGKIIIKKLSK